MGRRVKKTVYAYGSGGWQVQKEILFVYDGWNLIQEKEVSGTGDPLFDKYYVWGLDLSQSIQGAGGIGGLVCRVSGGEVRHYFYDANGNVGQLVNPADGAVTARYEYDPFGKAIVADGVEGEGNAVRFSTKYWDEETDLVYYGLRFYVPELGRWTNRDPLGEYGGLNLYLFLINSGGNNYDYLGLFKGDAKNFEESLKKNKKITRSLFKKRFRTSFTPWGIIFKKVAGVLLTSEERCLEIVAKDFQKRYLLNDEEMQALQALFLSALHGKATFIEKLKRNKKIPIYWVLEKEWPRIYLNTKNYITKKGSEVNLMYILNYAGPGVGPKNRRKLRPLRAKTPGRSAVNDTLDEYPLASSEQGGKKYDVSVMWVPRLHNDQQGRYLWSEIYSKYKMIKGDAFLTIIVPTKELMN